MVESSPRSTFCLVLFFVIFLVDSLAFNHNGNMLVTAGADGFVRVFDMATSSPIMGWPAHDGQVGESVELYVFCQLMRCWMTGVVCAVRL